MNKEVITRTSGRRLGYVQQMFVDPDTLSVVSLYLRKAASSIGAKNGEEHMRLYSVKQVSDVILVHDENVLMDPPADETLGFYPLVGATVVTQDAQELGKVRDYVFDPDTGAIGTIKYDRLGIPTIPQQLFDCYCISYAEVVALGPTRVIVRAGTAQRAIKQNDGILDNLSSAAGGALSGWVFGGKDGEEKRMAAARGDTSFRSDEGYVQWYEQYGRDSGAEPPGTPEYAAEQREWKRARGQPVAPAPVQQQAPRALPPPQTPTFAQAAQPAPQRQPPPPTASASRGGSAAAQRAPQQPARMQQQQQAPVVVPDAVIIPGSVQRPTGGLGSGGVVGGPTRIAEYRQL
ncbi:hypothetical protein COHA_009220 [Chlorella ohadii]|uniref:PRC-barrel domain-containing protein n=1 Tax=Chlorella ohadii TaxID=2649997 RepID=A0AAD5DIC4_9CHLO|nr:hypothetical protein COHA_009220 [Chlorella ohadii]